MHPSRVIAVAVLMFVSGTAAAQIPLTIQTDSGCTLSINGKDLGVIRRGPGKTVSLAPGKQVIRCEDGGDASTEQTIELHPGDRPVMSVKLHMLPHSPRKPREFSPYTNGAVIDRKQGLVWTASDNGKDVGWADARKACASVSPGSWSLPSKDELGSLYDGDEKLHTSCGPLGQSSCKVSGLFHLGALSYWTSPTTLPGQAWALDLETGDWENPPVAHSMYTRALCVRRSP